MTGVLLFFWTFPLGKGELFPKPVEITSCHPESLAESSNSSDDSWPRQYQDNYPLPLNILPQQWATPQTMNIQATSQNIRQIEARTM